MDEVNSILAVQKTMSYLKLRLDQPRSSPIEHLFEYGRHRALMHVEFCNDVHSHQGPYIEFDETIRGFGMQYQVFKPQFQHFSFSASNNEGMLVCKGKGFEFSMKFNMS